MQFEYSPYILPLIAVALVAAATAVYAWTRRSMPGAKSLTFLSVGLAIWSLGYSLEIMGANLATKYFWGVLQYVGIASIPYFLLTFSYSFSNQGREPSPRFIAASAIVPVLTILLALTTRWHGLIWSEYNITRTGDFSALGVSYGFWFWIHLAYSYAILLAGAVFLTRMLRRRQGLYRRQAVTALVALLAPWVGNALYLTGNSPIPHLDLTPFAFTVSAVALSWALFGYHLVDIAPLARDRVVDSMREGLIALDQRGYVADINPAAQRMLGVSAARVIGRDAAEMFAPWPHLFERFRGMAEADEQIVIGSGNAQQRVHINISSMEDYGQIIGRVILLRALGDEFAAPPQEGEGDGTARRDERLPGEADAKDSAQSAGRTTLWDALIAFFIVRIKNDLVAPEGVSPSWYRTRERVFTTIARVAAALGTFSLILITDDLLNDFGAAPIFIAIISLLWILGLARNVKFESRVGAFMFLTYGLGFAEALIFGFSVECFIFFMSFTVTASLMASRRGAIGALALAILTLGAFAVLIGSGTFAPFATAGGRGIVSPASVEGGVSSLLIFSASAIAVTSASVSMLESLNIAWQKEQQSLNLLLRERDLLDQRITERSRDLAQAEPKYRGLVEQLPLVVYRDAVDDSGVGNYISPQVESMFGYSLDEWMQDPHFGSKITHPDDREWTAAASAEAMDTSMEYRLVASDGRAVWVRDDSVLVRDENGQPQFIQGILQDITERKQAEEQIRKLSQAVEQSGNSIIITDTDGNIEYVNPQFTKTTGYLPEEALGKNPRLLKSGRQGLEFYQKLWNAITAGKTWRGVFHNKRKNGELYWESAVITPVQSQDGKVTHFVAIKEDITRQKEMEDALQQSYQSQSVLNSLLSLSLEHQTMEQMLDQSLDIILTIPWLPTQPKGGIFLAEEPGVLSLKSQRNLDAPLLTICARVPFGHCLCGRAAASAGVEFADCVDERHDNRYEGMAQHGHYSVPILFREETIGALVLYLDAGRARDPREVAFLEAVASTLSAMIRDKRAGEAIAAARDQALEASRFKSHLLSRVSHELRTPLGGALGYAELLQVGAFGELNDKQREAAQNIVGSARYLDVLISDLLDEAQIESKSIRLHHESFPPAKLLERVGASMSIMARNKQLSFLMELDPELPASIVGDEGRLQQVLYNLIGNAIKYTRKGEVLARFIRVSEDRWAMQVRDTGVGIPEEAREFIFDPFRQVDNSITNENRGAGLGLAITKQLVELMGGTIALESEVGKGSMFTVLLPLIAESGESP